MSASDEIAIVSLVPLRPGVGVKDFATFATTVDRPAWLSQEVVRSFQAFQVIDDTDPEGRIDVMEIMVVRSRSEWESVAASAGSVQPLAAQFEALAEPSRVRRFLAKPFGSEQVN